MFTGIIKSRGKVKTLKKLSEVYELAVIPDCDISGLERGESIAVDGVCLSLKKIEKGILYFDIMSTTYNNTRFKYLRPNSIVNIEFPLKSDDFISGHLVTGHVDCVGEIYRIKKDRAGYNLYVKFHPSYRRYIVEKGSVAINGVSLTVQEIKNNILRVDLIPITIEDTNLGTLKVRDKVNLEFDYIVKIVSNFLKNTLD